MDEPRVSMRTKRLINKNKLVHPPRPSSVQSINERLKRLKLDSSSSDSSSDDSSSDSSDSSSSDSSSDSSLSSDTMMLPVLESFSDTSDDEMFELPEDCPYEGDFVCTKNVETKYFAVIPYHISLSPTWCKRWNAQFGNVTSKLDGLSLNECKMDPHYDLIPVLLSFKDRSTNNNRLWAELHKKGSKVDQGYSKFNDVNVKIGDEITLVLRNVPYQEIERRIPKTSEEKRSITEEVVTNLPFVPHTSRQKNIYDMKVKDPLITWILHSILHEQMKGYSVLESSEVDLIMEEERYVINLMNIYQALFVSCLRQ